VFRDFNAALDREAVADVLRAGLPLVLVPYEAAREIELTRGDLDHLSAKGGASAWVAGRARGWLEYWRRDIGRGGFYPFDLLAALQVVDPAALRCAWVHAWVGRDPAMRWPFPREGMLLATVPADSSERGVAWGSAVYCSRLAPSGAARLHARIGTRAEAEKPH
jgi:hypothetical protein